MYIFLFIIAVEEVLTNSVQSAVRIIGLLINIKDNHKHQTNFRSLNKESIFLVVPNSGFSLVMLLEDPNKAKSLN